MPQLLGSTCRFVQCVAAPVPHVAGVVPEQGIPGVPPVPPPPPVSSPVLLLLVLLHALVVHVAVVSAGKARSEVKAHTAYQRVFG